MILRRRRIRLLWLLRASELAEVVSELVEVVSELVEVVSGFAEVVCLCINK